MENNWRFWLHAPGLAEAGAAGEVGDTIRSVFGQPERRVPWWYHLYLAASFVPSFMDVLGQAIGISADAVSSINGGRATCPAKYTLSVGPLIRICEFKALAKAEGGTVNDFFLLLCARAIGAYMRSHEQEVVLPERINGLGIMNMRDLRRIDAEFMEFCAFGTFCDVSFCDDITHWTLTSRYECESADVHSLWLSGARRRPGERAERVCECQVRDARVVDGEDSEFGDVASAGHRLALGGSLGRCHGRKHHVFVVEFDWPQEATAAAQERRR